MCVFTPSLLYIPPWGAEWELHEGGLSAYYCKTQYLIYLKNNKGLTLSWPAGHVCPTYKESFQDRWDEQYPTYSPCCHLPWSISIPLNQSECTFQRNSLIQMILCAMLRSSRLRHCATSRKVAGSIPDGVIGFFYWHNHSGRTMALGSTQLLIAMSTRNLSWG
jgi:hypothetical protein